MLFTSNRLFTGRIFRMRIDDLPRAVARVLDAGGSTTLGTGFLVTTEGYMLTCWHVIEGEEYLQVQFEGEPPVPVQLCADLSNPDADIAVLRLVGPTTRTPVELDSAWQYGDRVWAVGYQHQQQVDGLYPLDGRVSGDTVTGSQRRITLPGMDVQPGLSGAPVFDLRTSKIFAMVSARFDGKETGFAIPIVNATERWPELATVIANGSRSFVENTAELFRVMGYEIESQRQPPTGDLPSFYAGLNAGATRIRALVGCMEGERDTADVQQATREIETVLNRNDLDRAFLITWSGKRLPHHDADVMFHRVEQLSFDELESKLIDFSGYLRSIEHDYANFGHYAAGANPVIEQFKWCDLKLYHVDVGCRESSVDDKESSTREVYPSAREEFYKFLRDDTQNQICFLGDYGTGKTSLCLQLTYELATKHLADPLTWSRIPLFIPLQALDLRTGIHRLVLDTLADYGVRVATLEALKYMMRHGRFVLILDAFDEVADQLDRRGVIRLFSKIRELAGPTAKIVLTGRTHYFHNESQALNLLAPKIDVTSSSGRNDRANFRVLELMKFDEHQIKSLMSRYWSSQGTDANWQKLLGIHDLADLAKTPMLTHLIISSLDELSANDSRSEINSAKLYDRYTTVWLDRDDHRANVAPEERRRFMEQLAWRMYRDECLTVPRENLEEAVSEFAPKARQGDSEWLDRLDTNIRTCSFLARNRHGDYQFAHRSFMEFFVAKRLVRHMDSWSRKADLWTRPVPYEISSFVGQLVSSSPKDVARLKLLSVDRTNNGFLRGLCIDIQMILGDTVKDEPMIFAVAVSPDGSHVATACGDGQVRILGADLEPITEFTEHKEWVRTLAYSANGRFFASGGWDKKVVVRSMPDYAVHLELDLPDRVNAVCFSPDGTSIICGGYDRSVSIWDLEAGRILKSLAGHSDSVQSIVIDTDSNVAISGSTDRTIRKWSLEIVGDDVPFRAQGGPIRCIAISPTGKYIATGSWTGELILWDVGQLMRAWQSTSHKNMISDFGFAPDGKQFVSCSDDGSIKVWSVESDQPIITLQGDDFVVTVCYSTDGRVLYSGGYDSIVRAWDTTTWTLIKSTQLKGNLP